MTDNTFMDSQLLAVEHTAIRFCAKGRQCSLPSRAGDLTLTHIGAGAIVSRETKALTIEEGYRRISDLAFTMPSALERLDLPSTLREATSRGIVGGNLKQLCLRRCLDGQGLQELQGSSLPAGGGIRVLNPDSVTGEVFEPFSAISRAMGSPLTTLAQRMRALFVMEKPDDSIFEKRRCFDLAGNATETEEYAVVMDMIRAGQTGWRHSEAERTSDARGCGKLNGWRTSIMALGYYRPEDASRGPDGKVYIDLYVIKARLATPSLLPILWKDRRYYLYSRNHLNADANCPYFRDDIGIFDESGLVTDRQLSEEVYGRARMLMVL